MPLSWSWMNEISLLIFMISSSILMILLANSSLFREKLNFIFEFFPYYWNVFVDESCFAVEFEILIDFIDSGVNSLHLFDRAVVFFNFILISFCILKMGRIQGIYLFKKFIWDLSAFNFISSTELCSSQVS